MSAIFSRALTSEGLRSLPFIEMGVERQFTLNQIQSRLNRAGLNTTITETDFIVRAMLEHRLAGGMVRESARDFIPDYENLPAALTSTLRSFSFDVQLSGINPFTGEPHIRHVTVSTDRFLTTGEIEDAALAFAHNDVLNYEQVQIEALVVTGRRRAILR